MTENRNPYTWDVTGRYGGCPNRHLIVPAAVANTRELDATYPMHFDADDPQVKP